MDDNHFLNNDLLKAQIERPTFVTVLTIITFIVSGLWFLFTVYGTITYSEEKMQAQLEKAIVDMEEAAQGKSIPMLEKMQEQTIVLAEEQMENHLIFSILGIFSCALSLLGAYFMYNMKKIGFHIYVTSKIVGLAPLAFITLSWLAVLSFGLIAFIALAFIIMYAVNLKHFKS